MADFRNFCCRSGGSNLNAGSRNGSSTTEPGTSADLTYASGSWVAGTGVFTVASGDPVADGVAVDDHASVYADGSTETGFIGRVTGRTTTTITVSLSNRMGSPPTDGTGNRTLKIGGAWQGVTTTSTFPFNLARMSEISTDTKVKVRINLKNDQTYSPRTSCNPDGNTFQLHVVGYTSSYNDGGMAVFDGGTSGASFSLFTGARGVYFKDIEFMNNGATGNASGVFNGGGYIYRCVFHDLRGPGAQGAALLHECEFYACNTSNTTNFGAVRDSSRIIRCFIHDNTGSNNDGITGASAVVVNSIVMKNGRSGYRFTSTPLIINSDFYDNVGSALHSASGSGNADLIIINSNFLKNGGYAVASAGAFILARLFGCGFGSGTQANTLGVAPTTINVMLMEEYGTVNYAADVTPWTDPANGDFRISLAAAKNAGWGDFLQTASGYAGTVGYPDIGAAQAQSTGGGGSAKPCHPFSQQVIA